MTTRSESRPEPHARKLRALDELHGRELNFDLELRADFTRENGWQIDDYCQPLPPEEPGEPEPGGSWEIAKALIADYEFADPKMVRAVFHSDKPLESRNMLLEARFLGLTFRFGVRVGGVNDATLEEDGRPVRVWGWNYRTLQGHLEQGQMDFEARKWLDSGDVEFRIDAFSRPAEIPNPFIRLGFRIFGRGLQRKFARRACMRMAALVEAERRENRGAGPMSTIENVDVEPVSSDRAANRRMG